MAEDILCSTGMGLLLIYYCSCLASFKKVATVADSGSLFGNAVGRSLHDDAPVF